MPPFDELGREIPDPTPAPHRSQFTRVNNLVLGMQRFIQEELSRQADAMGMDTEEEANDFEIDDENDTWTAYEEEDYRASNPDPSPAEPPPAPEPTPPAAPEPPGGTGG